MTDQRFWTLLSVKLATEASFEEKMELTEFLLDRPEMQLRAITIENFWNTHAVNSAEEAQSSFSRHLARIKHL